MRYPENLKIGDTIGICAPSDGITEESSIQKLEQAINNLKQKGYQVIETQSVRKSIKGRSASAEQRAKEFMRVTRRRKSEINYICYRRRFSHRNATIFRLGIYKNITTKMVTRLLRYHGNRIFMDNYTRYSKHLLSNY